MIDETTNTNSNSTSRSGVGDTVDTVRESAGRAAERVGGTVRSALDETGRTLAHAGSQTVDSIRANPTPATLIAAGAGLLLLGGALATRAGGSGRSRSPQVPFPDGPGARAGTERTGTASYSHGAYPYREPERSGSYDPSPSEHTSQGERSRSSVGDRVRPLAEAAQERAQQLGHGVTDWTGRQPLATGAVALLAGAAIGLLLPRTEAEDSLFGEQRDRLFARANETVRDGAQIARRSLGEARDTLQEEIGRHDLSAERLKEGVRAAAHEVEEIAEKTVSRAREAAAEEARQRAERQHEGTEPQNEPNDDSNKPAADRTTGG